MSFTFVVGAVFLLPGKREIVLEWSQAPNLWLILDGIEDFVDRVLQQSGLPYRSIALEWTW